MRTFRLNIIRPPQIMRIGLIPDRSSDFRDL